MTFSTKASFFHLLTSLSRFIVAFITFCLHSYLHNCLFCTLFFLQISSASKLLAHQDFFHSVSRNSSSSSSLIKHTPTHIHTEFKGFLVVCCICHHRVPNMSWIFGFCILLLRKKRKGKARQVGYPLLLVCILQ